MHTTSRTFAQRAAAFGDHVDAAAHAPDAPTPCEGWAVRDLVEHVISTEREFLQARELDPGPMPATDDVSAAWRAHAERVESLLVDGVAEREYDGYFGRTTIGATLADFYGWDLLLHGWDLAAAVGREWSPSEEEVDWLLRTTAGFGDALYSAGICRPPVPVPGDAPARDRLLGLVGRDPGWSPAG